MALSLSDCLFATIAYADIFTYPMTRDDVYLWCIRKKPGKNCRNIQIRHVVREKDMYILKGRKKIIDVNVDRRAASRKKWIIARRIGKLLRWVPTISLVGVTGGLSMNNASLSDDIDMFFIVSPGVLWITRFIITILVDSVGIRRRPEEKRVANKVCLNMFMTEDALALSKQEQDLFSAHEVLQMTPLWAKSGIYEKFLYDNSWVKEYLPVAWTVKRGSGVIHTYNTTWWGRFMISLFRIIEFPAKLIQIWYMAGKRTREVISDNVLRFHPRDARVWILPQLQKRLGLRNIPLDNIFYAR